MISLLKALIPGALLAWIVGTVIASGGSRGGFLNIHRIDLASVEFYWSWPLFIGGTALGWFYFQSTK